MPASTENFKLTQGNVNTTKLRTQGRAVTGKLGESNVSVFKRVVLLVGLKRSSILSRERALYYATSRRNDSQIAAYIHCYQEPIGSGQKNYNSGVRRV